jgi:hypothetical protein
MVNWLSLAVPLAYLGVLIGSLATFSSLYRKRKARTSLSFGGLTTSAPIPRGLLYPLPLALCGNQTKRRANNTISLL